jgi:hypothetical protein
LNTGYNSDEGRVVTWRWVRTTVVSGKPVKYGWTIKKWAKGCVEGMGRGNELAGVVAR